MSIPKDRFFELHAERGEALTFDDVSLRFKASSVIDSQVDTRTWFSAGIPMNSPYASAAMDRVTGPEMAKAMAMLGGIGIVHSAMDLDSQRKAIRTVKFALNSVISEPISYFEDQTLQEILKDREDSPNKFHSFLVKSRSTGKLTGMLTSSSFKFPESMNVSAGSAMKPLESKDGDNLLWAPTGTTQEEAYKIMTDAQKTKLPLRNEDGTIGGLYVFSDVSRIIRGNPENYTLDDEGRLRVAAAVSTREHPMERIEAMLRHGLDVVVFDSSIGDHEIYMLPYIREARVSFPDLQIVAGNISDSDSVPLLIAAGVDGIQVGQGPGSICTTRRELGGGLAQITAVWECAQILRAYYEATGERITLGSDGGIEYRGDVSKAIAAGADYVVMGSFLAGTTQTPVKPIRQDDGNLYYEYRGMGSTAAQRDNNLTNRDGYSFDGRTAPPQGVEAVVQSKGSVHSVIGDLDVQLRKSMAACDAPNIEQHQLNTRFHAQTAAGIREAHAHGVKVIN